MYTFCHEDAAMMAHRHRFWLRRAILTAIAAFYAYGAFVHVANMAGLTGIDWFSAPFKWQVLDIVYLILDLTVMVALIPGRRVGVIAFYAAAVSQIMLYTLFRDWIMDVGPAFTRTPEEIAYLDTLVGFHVVSMVLVSLALTMPRSRNAD